MKILKLTVVLLGVLSAFAFTTPAPKIVSGSGSWVGYVTNGATDFQDITSWGYGTIFLFCPGEVYRCGFMGVGFDSFEEARKAAHSFEDLAPHFPPGHPFITPEGGVITFYLSGNHL